MFRGPLFLRYIVIVGALLLQRSHSLIAPSRFLSCNAVSRGTIPTHFMSTEEGEKDSKVFEDGTFFDDEVDSAPKKEGISDSMKERLRREASAGLDPDTKQTNVLLYIMAAVAVLVVAGGAGIFY